ncbi:hypothetical protein OB988_21440 [Bacillus cereus]|uniref:Uncharacterized protein n=1 Tax=Bacillus cereus 03BB108 TaxID=451709 RepID=A0AAN0SS83_BACCE|nr:MULTISPECIES: hypothetical protein [Bacillus cereus group]AJI09077.1 hypothetical protein AK40_6141 [Bacillus cereus 03BB108]EDX59525.1 hypothetical protein BC03BB108_D0089 [Bacillus cereus 03BB108]MCU5025030.1 hypothetical protein [Bacillus cereus]USP55969.1 hypothetical protein J2N67_006218 [Bacillus thuringiensis]
MDKDIVFVVKKDVYWEDWGSLKKVFLRGNYYKGTLHENGKITAESPYYDGISDYVDLDSIEIRFKLHDWVIDKQSQRTSKISAIDTWNGLIYYPDYCIDVGDFELIEDCRLATDDEIEKEKLERERSFIIGIQKIVEQVQSEGEYFTPSFVDVELVLQEAKKQGLGFIYEHSTDPYYYRIYIEFKEGRL